MRLSDDPDPMMIQIQWWSKSSDDVLWWSRSGDDPDPIMKMTWRWRRPDDDQKYIEKKTCADKLCRENTFLVKRECWCNYNFGMYSSIFLMYCNLMFILRCIVMYLSHVIPRYLFREVSMRRSCQVIVGNPPIVQGIKVPTVVGPLGY